MSLFKSMRRPSETLLSMITPLPIRLRFMWTQSVPRIVRFEDVPVLEKRNDIFEIKVVFSEPVNGFQVPADMTIEIDGLVDSEFDFGK